MKTILAAGLCVFVLGAAGASAQSNKPATLKSVLLEQLKTSHTEQDWFVPASKAVAGLTVEQAAWKPNKDSHSVAQLVNHLTFWDKQQLAKFKDDKAPDFNGSNDETFEPLKDKPSWDALVKQMDDVMSDWEKAIEGANDAKLQKWASTIAHIGMHNAYHTGQILYARKLQGSWDPAKGVR